MIEWRSEWMERYRMLGGGGWHILYGVLLKRSDFFHNSGKVTMRGGKGKRFVEVVAVKSWSNWRNQGICGNSISSSEEDQEEVVNQIRPGNWQCHDRHRTQEIRKRIETEEKNRYYRLVRLVLNSGKCNPVREVPWKDLDKSQLNRQDAIYGTITRNISRPVWRFF